MKKYILLLIGLTALVSCSTDEYSYEYSDDYYLKLAYDKNYTYPAGFYHEKDLTGSRYYLNTVSISPTENRDSRWIELHTTSKDEARTWAELTNENSSEQVAIVQENETEKYFEFVGENTKGTPYFVLWRAHRSDYFIPQFDKFKDLHTVGIYNGEATMDKVKECMEYLWDYGAVGGIPDKVVESRITDKGGKFEYTILSLSMTYGDWNLYDYANIYTNKLVFDKGTKVITLVERKLVKQVRGNYNDLGH